MIWCARLVVFVLLGVALSGCNLECLFDRCCARDAVLDQRQVDFEGLCPGDSCNVVSLGSTAVVPSLLPGDHALALDPNASVTWTWSMTGNGEGTSLAMSFRCDDGGTLRLSGEGVTDPLSATDVGATRDWQRRLWPLRAASTTFQSQMAAREGRFEALVRVTNTGRARCVIDWLRFVAAPHVCTDEEGCLEPLFGPGQRLCAGACVYTQSDAQNCGACGQACPSGVSCVNGVCDRGGPSCPGACYGVECGLSYGFGCGRAVDCGACRSGMTCSFGRCVEGSGVDSGVFDTGAFDTGPPARTAVVAGRRCSDGSGCLSPSATFACVATSGGRACTSGCTQGTTTQEEAQCGGRYSTCLIAAAQGADAGARANLCTRSCVAAASSESAGQCPPGSLCTTHWIIPERSPMEVAGCLPFCRSDADCADPTTADGGALVCHRATGRCVGTPPSELAAPDGAPCNPMLAQTSGTDPCRGACLPVDAANPTHGRCASLIDLRETRACAQPGITARTIPDDNLGVCDVASCARNDQCPAGLVCAYPEDASTTPATVRRDLPPTCGYATTAQPDGITSDGGTRSPDAGMDAALD